MKFNITINETIITQNLSLAWTDAEENMWRYEGFK